MLTADTIRTAIIMTRRAQCSGEEAEKVTTCIKALETIHEIMTAPPPEPEGDKPLTPVGSKDGSKVEGKQSNKGSKK